MKAVLFDVYGTLLTGPRSKDRENLLRRVVANFGMAFPSDRSLAECLDQEIAREHQQSDETHPEVEIREIWKRLLPDLQDPAAFSLAAEEAIHPVALVPHAAESILKLHAEGIKIGIVSNAQAYTRTLLGRHLGPAWECFSEELLFFSYEHRTSKPGLRLFQLAIDQLATIAIGPHETMMIGDSMENDIKPAQSLGMKNHLVAGSRLDLPNFH